MNNTNPLKDGLKVNIFGIFFYVVFLGISGSHVLSGPGEGTAPLVSSFSMSSVCVLSKRLCGICLFEVLREENQNSEN